MSSERLFRLVTIARLDEQSGELSGHVLWMKLCPEGRYVECAKALRLHLRRVYDYDLGEPPNGEEEAVEYLWESQFRANLGSHVKILFSKGRTMLEIKN